MSIGQDTLFDLGPHVENTLSPFDIQSEVFKLIATHPLEGATAHLFIWGHVTYKDVFPKTEPHITRFCWEVIGWRGDPDSFDTYSDGTPKFQPAFRLCPKEIAQTMNAREKAPACRAHLNPAEQP